MRLYSHQNCTGKFLQMSPATGTHHRLSIVDFNNRAVSVGPCSPDVAKNVVPKCKNAGHKDKNVVPKVEVHPTPVPFGECEKE